MRSQIIDSVGAIVTIGQIHQKIQNIHLRSDDTSRGILEYLSRFLKLDKEESFVYLYLPQTDYDFNPALKSNYAGVAEMICLLDQLCENTKTEKKLLSLHHWFRDHRPIMSVPKIANSRLVVGVDYSSELCPRFQIRLIPKEHIIRVDLYRPLFVERREVH
jgi:hypothetical protein